MTNRHVLLGMREHGLRRILAGALRSAGHDVVEAFDDPDVAVELRSSERPFDVIVRDARRAPDELLEHVRRLRSAGVRVPVLMLVRKIAPALMTDANELGAALLEVPVSSHVLRTALHALPPASASASAETRPHPAGERAEERVTAA